MTKDVEKTKYWLKLNKDFLKSPQIKVIKNLPNGKDYIIFYLSLLLESIETVGHLRFSEKVPYNEEMLASVTDTNVDIVRAAVKIFSDLGLLQRFEDGTLFLPQVPQMTGKESESAERVREYRSRLKQKSLQCNEDVTKCNDNIYIDIKKNIKNRKENIDIDKDNINKINNNILETTTTNNIYSVIENNFGRTLSPIEFEKIEYWLSLFDEKIIKYAVEISIMNNKKTFNYVNGILKNWKSMNFNALEEIKNAEQHDNAATKTKIEVFDYDWLNDESTENTKGEK